MSSPFNFADPSCCINARLRLSLRQLNKLYAQHMEKSGLKGTQFTVLMTLKGMGRTQIQPLAEYLGTDRTTLTRNLERLKQMGWVLIENDPGDRRIHWIELTEEGREQAMQALPFWQQAQSEVLHKLGDDATNLFELLERLSA